VFERISAITGELEMSPSGRRHCSNSLPRVPF